MSSTPDNIPGYIQALRKPVAYPHAVNKIQLIETHISWVLLTGEYVYKIKKPLTLDFLDFSTLEKRRAACEAELRLNRRLAPEIYLDVVAISGADAELRVKGAGKAREYAVKMRQFPQSAEFDRSLEAGELTAATIEETGKRIARFHAGVAVERSATPYGSSTTIVAAALANFEALEPAMKDTAKCSALAELRTWTEQQNHALSSVFGARKRDGFVRECHGDLHLANLADLPDGILAFDCIEFAPEFRWIDVMSETAFLAMDLAFHQRLDLAYCFMNSYLSATGDYAGLGVFRYYLVYRALVRAKIAAISAKQHDKPAARREAMARAERYIQLAVDLAHPGQPGLLITYGLSGSGKSWLAHRMAMQLPAIHMRSDVERKRLAGLSAQQSSESLVGSGLYSVTATERTYTHLARQAEGAVRAGEIVIIDASFLDADKRDQFQRLATRLAVPFLILWCRAERDVLRARVRERESRQERVSEAGLEVLEHQIETLNPLREPEMKHIFAVETNAASDIDRLSATLRECLDF